MVESSSIFNSFKMNVNWGMSVFLFCFVFFFGGSSSLLGLLLSALLAGPLCFAAARLSATLGLNINIFINY